ncbi:MAG: insulinase family protein [Rubrivivax sp.]|nr:insulinase family protein [Rubrivivax sp.]
MFRSWSIVGLLALLSLSALAAVAQPQTAATQPQSAVTLPQGMVQVTSVEGITEFRLANGLQVLLVPDDSKPTTTVNLTYRVGSRHENYGETGMAHLLEHLIFKGTPTTQNALAEMARRGLRANGSTGFDRTNYFASFSANEDNLRWYLGWLADSMVNSFIAKKDLDSEMTVVRNEFEMGENNPGRVLLQKTMGTMYQWHNYGKTMIGTRSDIENVDIARLQAFYRQYYQPDNATLIVSGRFDAAQVLAQVAKDFGAIPKPQRVLQPTYTLEPVQDGERQVTLRRIGGTPSIYMSFHMPAGPSPEFAAVEMIASVLGDTPGGRLHKRLVERQLAAQAFGFAWDLAEPGLLLLGAGLAPGQDVTAARAAMAAAIDSLVTEPVTAEELERARTQWLNSWDEGFADPERVGVALSEAIGMGDWRLFFLRRDQVRQLTLADVQRVAGAWLRPDNRTVGLYLPTAQPERAPAPTRVDVAAQVKDYRGDATAAVAETFDATPANLDARTQLSRVGGLQVALLPKGTRGQAVQARLRLHYGDVDSLKGQQTVAALAASLVEKGGAGMSRQQVADAFDRLQANVSFSGSGQTLNVAITTKRDRLPAVVELVGKLLRDPAYAADPLEEARRQSLTGIESQRKEPEAVIANVLARHGNPYARGDLRHARSFDEMAQDVKAVTTEQLKAFHRRFLSAAQGEFAAVGDLDPAAVTKALQTVFADWRQPAGGALAYQRMPQPLVAVPPQRFVEVTPDKANASLQGMLALPISDRHPDYAALSLANYIFGLSQSSRLWMRIRETEGLSYSVYSLLRWSSTDDNTPWTVNAIFAPANQPKVEAALKEELARSLKEGFTQQELEQGRTGLLNERRLSRAQDASVTGALAQNLYLGRSFAYSQQVDDAMAKLTVEQLNAAWRKYIQPERLVLAWGGDFKPPQ